MTSGVRLRISGIVQGVGFRPHVYRLAKEFGLRGSVWNDTAGATIELFGPQEQIEGFVETLIDNPPPLARLDRVEREVLQADAPSDFRIAESRSVDERTCLVSPDVGVCADCLSELFDPDDPRYEYPYINCTNCGPRFTIIEDLPYDRPNTTMAEFQMCELCERQYNDPGDRRFHAQPVACPECGPTVRLGELSGMTAIRHAAQLLSNGAILAIKGIGGYHLACDARNEEAVQRLRRRKRREEKPLAMMAASLETAAGVAIIGQREKELLESAARPIVLVPRAGGCSVADSVAPGNPRLGIMLPYAPLHYLLFSAGAPELLVMTSGNVSEEPIAFSDDDAYSRLSGIADAFLTGERKIHTRCDDSVVQIIAEEPSFLRRSRGYVPLPIEVPFSVHGLLAVGGELKNTFAVGRKNSIFVSHHIGDLKNIEEYEAFTLGIEQFKSLAEVEPTAVACDLHPLYLSTTYAHRSGLPVVEVQHHHAHVASVMAENGLPNEPVIGVAFDGTGYGEDNTVWGAEFLVADYNGFERVAHFANIPLPGGDAAIRANWKSAAAYLCSFLDSVEVITNLTELEASSEPEIRAVVQMILKGVNCVPASSAGRLFDAVVSVVGLRQNDSFEGQGAMELESLAYNFEPSRKYEYTKVNEIVDVKPLVRGVYEDVKNGFAMGEIAASFHESLARCICNTVQELASRYDIRTICISGGTFQNRLLTERCLYLLRELGLRPYVNRLVPPNDGGLCLGQIAVAAWRSGRCA